MQSNQIFRHLCQIVTWSMLLLQAACAPTLPPSPTTTPTPDPPTLTPSPTLTPPPTPTATPIPPLTLAIHWPTKVSAIPPTRIEAELVPPPGVNTSANLGATVVDPQGLAHQTFTLMHQGANRYVSSEVLELPLDPMTGTWRLVISVETTFEVTGDRELEFQATTPPLHPLTGTLPTGVSMRVPQGFEASATSGDQLAGGQTWRYQQGELALWWAPGPTEPLAYNTALAMLEATHDTEHPPHVHDAVEETDWQGLSAIKFQEEWPGVEGGSAEAWVIQDSVYKLYILRVRTLRRRQPIPAIIYQVAQTLRFEE